MRDDFSIVQIAIRVAHLLLGPTRHIIEPILAAFNVPDNASGATSGSESASHCNPGLFSNATGLINHCGVDILSIELIRVFAGLKYYTRTIKRQNSKLSLISRICARVYAVL